MEYSDYSNICLAENATELLENTGMNEHAIELEEGKQPLFASIYHLSPVELDTWKTYIEINQVNDFIWLFKSPAGAPILLDQRPDKNLRFCVNYWGLNNITIKNRYPLSLIGK